MLWKRYAQNGWIPRVGSKAGAARRGRFTDTWIQDSASWICAASQETVISRQVPIKHQYAQRATCDSS
jgi:hypothetical protein